MPEHWPVIADDRNEVVRLLKLIARDLISSRPRNVVWQLLQEKHS